MRRGSSSKRVSSINSWQVLLTSFALVAVVCLATLSHPASAAPLDHNKDVEAGLQEDTSVQETEVLSAERSPRAARRYARQVITRGESTSNRNPNYGHDMSCMTDVQNNTIPAAHIMGTGGKFKKSDETSIVPGFQQRWRCAGKFEGQNAAHKPTHAFVDGGMCFNQTDKSLIVPTCGYYHIVSQILFKCKQTDPGSTPTNTAVYHLLKFDRNCDDWEEQPMSVMGRASINVDTSESTVTTYTSDIVKLCKKGRIWVEISDTHIYKDCRPSGDEHGTFMAVALISKTTCHWPPTTTLCNLDHAEDDE